MPKPNNQKLELTWIGKGEEPKLEPRILIEDPEFSYGDPNTENMLIHGDNLLALKALEQDYAGKIKCIYIDPPYNTGSAFEHYDDGVEHSLWLKLMQDRISVLHNLLAEDGSIWISIDDNEFAYLRVLMDEVFGRRNFITTVIWQKIYTVKNSAKHLSDMHDYILVFAKNIDSWRRNDLPRTEKQDSAYKNPDKDPRGPWKATPIQARNYYSKGLYEIETPTGKVIKGPPKGTYWRTSKEKFLELDADNRIWWGADGSNIPAQKRFLSEVQGGVVPSTMWFYDEVGHNGEAKNEIRKIFSGIDNDMFITPKPERLVKQILHIASDQGDIVIDSFLGSGTTAAVAHKMGRRWIGVELGKHAKTHCYPRLKQVVDGEQGGISKDVKWEGGGGFKFYTVAPSLLNQDKYGNWVISKDYNPTMLAAAIAKQEGFEHEPDPHIYWKQGKSSEKDFIFTTTQFITVEMLDKIHDEMAEDESLLITCKAFQKECENKYDGITIKKIPHMLLGKCEFGKDDYSLNIVNLPAEADQGIDLEFEVGEAPFEEPSLDRNTSAQQELF